MTWLDSGSDAGAGTTAPPKDNRRPRDRRTGTGAAPLSPGGPSYGQPPYGRPGPGPSYGYPSAPQPSYPQQGQPYGYPGPADDGPEYFGDGGHPGHGHGGHDPYAANNPGHTQAFSIDEAADYTQGSTYQAGSAAAPAAPIGPPLHWKELLKGIVLSPNETFLRMRDYTMWLPALIVTFLYGLLAVFGFDGARQDAISATLSNAVPIVLITAVVMVLGLFVLGVVTHTLARQLGGDGAWQPTVGLSMLITALTDAPPPDRRHVLRRRRRLRPDPRLGHVDRRGRPADPDGLPLPRPAVAEGAGGVGDPAGRAAVDRKLGTF